MIPKTRLPELIEKKYMRDIVINRAFAEFCLQSLKQFLPKYLKKSSSIAKKNAKSLQTS